MIASDEGKAGGGSAPLRPKSFQASQQLPHKLYAPLRTGYEWGHMTVVGVAWYREDQYALLRALATDTDSMADTYEQWHTGVNKTMDDLREQGIDARRVDVDIRELTAWCAERRMPLDGKARSTYAAEKLQSDMSALQFSVEKPAKISWRVAVSYFIHRIIDFLRTLWPRRSRRGRDNPGLEGAGRLVPVKPTPPHHLVAARGLPPSERTYLYPKD
jgi:hypothetical protein